MAQVHRYRPVSHRPCHPQVYWGPLTVGEEFDTESGPNFGQNPRFFFSD